jgi:hypothetical protein
MHALGAVRRDINSQDSVANCKYLREFADAFRVYDAVLGREELQERVRAHSVVLVADYHALPASQRFAAELLEIISREQPVVLALEAVLTRDQHILQQWWKREISSDELRRRLRFDREWGYPWEPVLDLLNAARDHAEGLYGIDRMPREDMRRIRARDRHAAAMTREIRERHPGATIFVLFGESHMAPQHLPAAVKRTLPGERLLTILQNVDALYWQALKEQQPSACIAPVAIGEDAICVFNSSPLEKYESYRACLNRWSDAQQEQQDFAPAIYNLIFSLARWLGFRLDSPSNGTQPKFLADSLPEVVTLDENSFADATAGSQKSCLYLPQSNSFMIREFQIADAAAECARFLHFACRGMNPACANSLPLQHALARFGSRLLAPEQQIQEPSPGDDLYDAYLNAKVGKAELRHLFLSHLETREQADEALKLIAELGQR